MQEVRRFLTSQSMPEGDLDELPSSAKRFPDGAGYRIEIPSTEGPACLEAVLGEATARSVPVHRVSQGSGVFLLTDDELDRMARMAAESRVEVSLFARPGAGWGTSAMARSPAGAVVAAAAHGQEQLVAALADCQRAAAHGFRSVLISDVGVLAVLSAMRSAGELPAEMQAKVSVMLPAANAASARVFEDLGANTLNVPLDVYVESPDELGGFVRLHEIPELIRIAAPVYLKFGLRNAPSLYPSGMHLDATTVALARERVRRVQLGLELLARSGVAATISERGAAGLAVPIPALAAEERGRRRDAN